MAFEKPCPPGTYFNPQGYCGFDASHCNHDLQQTIQELHVTVVEEDPLFSPDVVIDHKEEYPELNSGNVL